MASSYPLETARLLLEPFRETHLTERYVAWLNDPEVVRYSELRHYRHTIASCWNYLAAFESSPDYFWAIRIKDGNQQHIGNISAHRDIYNKTVDIGILIGAKEKWGCGYGAEAWGAVCRFLLEQPDVRRVTAGAMASNRGMASIALKAGMVEEARRKGYFLLEDRPEDVVFWVLDKPLLFRHSSVAEHPQRTG
jgi:ribosomal-protein-alanine N-acetyltransferase